MRTGVGYEGYRAMTRFDGLDGVRAVAMLGVITWHGDQTGAWRWLNGWSAVEVFFVLSGYLIATLCLREEERPDGGFSLAGFIVRRTVRIMPLYFLVLLAYMAWALMGGVGGFEQLRAALPSYATYLNEFTTTGPFVHSWSLAIEEKFYLVWPALTFVGMVGARRSWRVPVALAATAIGLGAGILVADLWWTYAYAAILAGCLLAFVMHDRRTFAVAAWCAGPAGRWVVLAALVALQVVLTGRGAKAAYPFVVAAVIPSLVLRGSPALRLLETRPMVWMGKRSYGFYLVHMLVMSAVANLMPRSWETWVGGAPLMVGTVLVSLAVAACLHTWAESPLTRFGHLVSGDLRARRLARAQHRVPVTGSLVPA